MIQHEAASQLFLARHPVGCRVRVYYDPENPSDAVMVPGLPSDFSASVAFAVTWLLFFLGIAAVIAFSIAVDSDLERIEWLVDGLYR